MRNKIESIIVFIIACSIFLLFSTNILSQTPFERNFKKPAHGFGPILDGEVVNIDEKIILITTQSGNQMEVDIKSNTFFVTEFSIGKDQLKKGDNLLIIGHPGKGDTIFPMRILVMAAAQKVKEGPAIGTITELNPLTAKLNSGATKKIIISDHTRIVKEKLISRSEVINGTKVKVIAPIMPGTHNREAIKIVVVSAEKGISEIPRPDQVISKRNKLLSDLSQQPIDSDFIYGIWLGRGLYSNKELYRAFKVAGNLGIKYFKVEFKWHYIEPKNNIWKWGNKDFLDVEHIIQLAKHYNISIIPYFDTFMPWGETRHLDPYKGECEGPGSRWGQFQAPDQKEYAEYVFTVVDKLKKGGVDIKYIELDNEVSNINDGYQSRNCFINMTAKQIKIIQNAAYDKVKSIYPDIMISSTTFSFPGLGLGPFGNPETDKRRKNSFIKAYFEDSPKPKFDFLGLHEVLSGSGNPYTTSTKPKNADYDFNFGSYYNSYDMWREILDKYGYKERPIFNLESAAIQKGKQASEIIQKLIFARINQKKNRVIGWCLSQLSGSKKFTEGKKIEGLSVGITNLAEGYNLRDGYYGYYAMMSIFPKYPDYEGKIAGELNTRKPWVEKFRNNRGDFLYVAFIPYDIDYTRSSISLNVGPDKSVRLTKSDSTTSLLKSDGNGNIKLDVDQYPIFIEVIK